MDGARRRKGGRTRARSKMAAEALRPEAAFLRAPQSGRRGGGRGQKTGPSGAGCFLAGFGRREEESFFLLLASVSERGCSGAEGLQVTDDGLPQRGTVHQMCCCRILWPVSRCAHLAERWTQNPKVVLAARAPSMTGLVASCGRIFCRRINQRKVRMRNDEVEQFFFFFLLVPPNLLKWSLAACLQTRPCTTAYTESGPNATAC